MVITLEGCGRERRSAGVSAGGDGLDDATHVLATAKVPGKGPPVLQLSDGMLDADAP